MSLLPHPSSLTYPSVYLPIRSSSPSSSTSLSKTFPYWFTYLDPLTRFTLRLLSTHYHALVLHPPHWSDTRLSPLSSITRHELELSQRNISMPIEGLSYDITPIGMHYTLNHFDIPFIEITNYSLQITVLRTRKEKDTEAFTLISHASHSIKFEHIISLPYTSMSTTMECGGNGRSLLAPRPLSQPWKQEGVGTATWGGATMSSLFHHINLTIPDDSHLSPSSHVIFTGYDRGVQGKVLQSYERSLPLSTTLSTDCLLSYHMNGHPLPPQHGYPLRVVMGGWYGMTNVKWLKSITIVMEELDMNIKDRDVNIKQHIVIADPWWGYQQHVAYHFRSPFHLHSPPLSLMSPRSLFIPPGFPDFFTRQRFCEEGNHVITGRTWSGKGRIVTVEFSGNGGKTWVRAEIEGEMKGEMKSEKDKGNDNDMRWRKWTTTWTATANDELQTLLCRCEDSNGNKQDIPQNSQWSWEGVGNNGVQTCDIRVISVGIQNGSGSEGKEMKVFDRIQVDGGEWAANIVKESIHMHSNGKP